MISTACRLLRPAAAVLAMVLAGGVAAQNWPVKPVRFLVPWPPGGGADVMSRLLSPRLVEAFGQQFVIDNRGGAAGNIGAEIGAKSPPDGYTLVFAYSGTHAVNPTLYARMPFKDSDFAPVVWTASVPQVVVVHPSLPVRNMRELIALAKARPDQLTYGSSGNGAINHLSGELFKSMAGVRITHVPYKGGGPAAVALLGGEIGMILGEPATVVQHIRSGKVRALAVTSGKRSLGLPDLPTVAESGLPGYDLTSWNGLLMPAGTAREIVGRINTEVNRIIKTPEFRTRMLELGYEPVGGTPEAFGEFIRSEIVKWGKIVKATGMRID